MTRCGLCLCVLLGVSGSASADPILFAGPYAPNNWTLTLLNSDGSVNTAGAPNSITLTGSDKGMGGEYLPGDEGITDYTVGIPANGVVSFDWAYTAGVDDTPEFDLFGYLLNGAFFQLTDDAGPNSQGGSASVLVKAGDVFGFRIRSMDNSFGSATATISNFNAPVAAVPEPATLAVFGGAALASGLLLGRRRGARAG